MGIEGLQYIKFHYPTISPDLEIVLGVRTQIVISNSSLRERRGYTKFYYITDLFSVDMAIYDSIVSFQKIDAY